MSYSAGGGALLVETAEEAAGTKLEIKWGL